MSNELPRIKQISVDNDGVLITYDNRGYDAAAWLIDCDVYDNIDHPVTIYHSTCSKCGQQESVFPDEAGIYCRRCGSFMLNGQPGEFDKDAWLESLKAEEDAAAGGEPEEEHANVD